ncbi:hypothetical protein ACEQ8H_000246 [Pleosporales sp. CAS-2024a]
MDTTSAVAEYTVRQLVSDGSNLDDWEEDLQRYAASIMGRRILSSGVHAPEAPSFPPPPVCTCEPDNEDAVAEFNAALAKWTQQNKAERASYEQKCAIARRNKVIDKDLASVIQSTISDDALGVVIKTAHCAAAALEHIKDLYRPGWSKPQKPRPSSRSKRRPFPKTQEANSPQPDPPSIASRPPKARRKHGKGRYVCSECPYSHGGAGSTCRFAHAELAPAGWVLRNKSRIAVAKWYREDREAKRAKAKDELGFKGFSAELHAIMCLSCDEGHGHRQGCHEA